MDMLHRISEHFQDPDTVHALCSRCDITELRLRANRPVRIITLEKQSIAGEIVSFEILRKILNMLMQNSLYACEEELRQGYFTAEGGCRVGVCGKISSGASGIDRLANVGSLCIRIPRQRKGCAKTIESYLPKDRLCGILILSAPGQGKTTLLRDLIRILSETGRNIAVADERREIAACVEGIPSLDVGPCTDVIDGYPKAKAIGMLLRSCSPEMIAVDEIGSEADAQAIMDAAYCGIAIAASAHAGSIDEARDRRSIGTLLKAGIFEYCITLGPFPGEIREIHRFMNGEYRYVEGYPAIHRTSGQYCCGKIDFRASQAAL